MSATVTITKTQYEALKRRAKAYERIVSAAGAEFFPSPPVRSTKAVISAMRKTKHYSPAFLKSLEVGLSRSRHFTR